MHPHARKILLAVAVLTGIGLSAKTLLSRGPDFEIRFERQVPSRVPIDELRAKLASLEDWTAWHHQFRGITPRSDGSKDSSSAENGRRLIRVLVEPPKKQWKRFELDLAVTRSTRDRIEVELLADSKGRIEKLFSSVGWTITLLPDPQGQGTLIRGEARARTTSAKARMLGRVAPRIVMNQLFYPDLEALALPERRRQGEKHNGQLLPF